MKAFAIARSNLLRLLRDRSNFFFVFVFPLALVLLIGAQFGGDFRPRVGVAGMTSGEFGSALVTGLAETRLEITAFANEVELLEAIERGNVEAGLVVPDDFDRQLSSGGPAGLGFIARPDGVGPQLRATIEAVVAEQTAALTATRFAVEHGAGQFETLLTVAEQAHARMPAVGVTTRTIGEALFPETLGRFDLGASSQLLLFMFLNGLAGSAVLIQSRQLGISTRMLSTPTSIRSIVTGEALGRFSVVLLQGVYILVATLLLFQVNWGDPLGAAAVLVLFGLAAAGAAMLMGSIFRNDQQAAGVGVVAGLGLAALGGCMLPIELFSPTLRRVAHLTPHAWANDAFAVLVRQDGRIGDILPQLGVLLGFAVVLLALASWRLRRVITRP